MDGIQEFLRREAAHGFGKWKTAERFLEQTPDPQLMDFAIYSCGGGKAEVPIYFAHSQAEGGRR